MACTKYPEAATRLAGIARALVAFHLFRAGDDDVKRRQWRALSLPFILSRTRQRHETATIALRLFSCALDAFYLFFVQERIM